MLSSRVAGLAGRGLSQHHLAHRVDEMTAVEVNAVEAAKCRAVLECAPFRGAVIAGSALNGARPQLGEYDITVGNPATNVIPAHASARLSIAKTGA